MPVRLGQNFLINRNVARRIVEEFLPLAGPVLEIGPGRGILTEALASSAAGHRLVAVEIDAELAGALRRRLEPGVEVIETDIRQVDLPALFSGAAIALIGNIPYLISHDIVDWIIRQARFIERGQLLVQREFAAKLLSPPGRRTYGAQGVMFRHLFTVRRLLTVSPGSFAPRPKVVSEVVAFASRHVTTEDGPAYYRFLKQCFASRRKTLANNLHPRPEARALPEAMAQAGLPPSARAEEIGGDALYGIFRFMAALPSPFSG
jgi:16S rRNA (adenine1518-N6/adenine1519-N6)-dimethyltransferase